MLHRNVFSKQTLLVLSELSSRLDRCNSCNTHQTPHNTVSYPNISHLLEGIQLASASDSESVARFVHCRPQRDGFPQTSNGTVLHAQWDAVF